MFRVYKTFTIDCAHVVVGHKGKCAREHGHTYKIEAWLSGFCLLDIGYLVDFGDIKDVIAKKYDHQRLNDFPQYDVHQGGENPTAEILAVSWAREIGAILPDNVFLDRLRVWETPTAYAEWVNK